jgi:hypothetical protein
LIRVENKRTYKGDGIYIGRPSILGNLYSHLGSRLARYKTDSRDESVEMYEVWLDHEMKKGGAVKKEVERLAQLYKKNGELILICWCVPKKCHGHVLARVIEEVAKTL